MQASPEDLGHRLRRARLARGLSLDGLAERMGHAVTKAALSKYERGQSLPRPSILRQLSEALQVSAALLLRPVEADGEVHWLAYRKHSRLGKREQASLEAAAEERAQVQLDLLQRLRPGETPRFPHPAPARDFEDAELAAARLRAAWGVGEGPIERLVEHAEDAGAIVIEGPEDGRFDALSGRTSGGVPVIVLNPARPDERLRFDLAHELGHLVLDGSAVEPKMEEQLAHRFAAAFLVPAEDARRELGGKRSQLSRTELEHLKGKYGFSMQAWTRRARELGIVTESTYRSWQIWFRSQGLHVRESANYAGDERPRRLLLLCLQAHAEGLIDRSWVERNCPEFLEGLEEPAESKIQRLQRLTPEERRPILDEAARASAQEYAADPEVEEWLDFDDPPQDVVEEESPRT